jgi:Rrf2 family nitric oxide-sensitive transcriptional repressor
MRLTTYSDYALRTLIFLAAAPDQLATIADIAGGYGISANHLMKIVHGLAQAGFIQTFRGKRGGLRLARPASAIRVGEIVRQTEPDMALAPCMETGGRCVIEPCCTLQTALVEARAAFLDVLDRYSLADLAAPQARLIALLGIDGAVPAAPSAR